MKIKITPQAAAVEPKTYVLDDEPQAGPRMKHTPGPWQIPGSADLVGTVSADGGRDLIAQTYGINYAENARLISEAPTLLALLKRAKFCVFMMHGNSLLWREIVDCISRAEGEQP